jgi:hypothetical protein
MIILGRKVLLQYAFFGPRLSIPSQQAGERSNVFPQITSMSCSGSIAISYRQRALLSEVR